MKSALCMKHRFCPPEPFIITEKLKLVIANFAYGTFLRTFFEKQIYRKWSKLQHFCLFNCKKKKKC